MDYFDDPISGIPKTSGVYYWVYWPELDAMRLSVMEIELKLMEYTGRSLFTSERITGLYKFQADITEQWFPNNGQMFGLPLQKAQALRLFLGTPANVSVFSDFFKEVCFARPFYVGKANDLRSRLGNQHFKKKTGVLSEIDDRGISYSEIWVGWKEVKDTSVPNINNIFEEIFSRRTKPGLSKKPQ
ncbi:MAG: hypothetical protein IPF95_03615 [Flavobacteriales bacterium]|nr:hypothetical protein [Flavobacteriales bacterium]